MHVRSILERKGDWLERIKLYIHIKENGYGEKLMRFIAGQQNPYIEVELLTKLGEKREFRHSDFVISDDCESMEGLGCNTIEIAKSPDAEMENKLFMYQSREKIYQKLLGLTGAGEWKREERKSADTRIICVFSPGGGDQGTSLAFHKAMEYAESGKALYISLCEFPIYAGENTDATVGAERPGLSELILCAESSAFHEKLGELAFPAGAVWMVAPAGHYKDLLDYPPPEMMQFAKRMREQKLFDVIIFEIGELFEYTLEFLADADEVIVPEKTGIFAEIRKNRFQKYCVQEGHKELWERLQFVSGIRYEKEDEEIKRLLYGEEGGGAHERKRG